MRDLPWFNATNLKGTKREEEGQIWESWVRKNVFESEEWKKKSVIKKCSSQNQTDLTNQSTRTEPVQTQQTKPNSDNLNLIIINHIFNGW